LSILTLSASSATATSSAAASPGLGRLGRMLFCGGQHLLDNFYFCFTKWLCPLVRGFDVVFAFHSAEGNLFSCGTVGIGLAFFRFVDNDTLKLFLFVEKVRDVKERVSFQTDINESRLHTRQNAHDASFVNIADDARLSSPRSI
jgi:hypothetical protein